MAEPVEAQTAAAEQEWLDGWKAGPQRTRWTELPPQVGDAAPDFQLPNESGELSQLAHYWKERPLLLIFWRHYGCGCGMERARRVQDEYPDYLKAGAQLAIIGQGEAERATAYAKKYELPPIPILCDPEYKVYERYGLLEGKESQILFDAPEPYLDRDLAAGLQLAAERKAAGRPLVDNSWLLPGEFVIDTSGTIRLAYRYNYCEDFPDPRVLLAAIREAGKIG
jgi:peroxiredoxin